jgi:HK97 family phage portal protein
MATFYQSIRRLFGNIGSTGQQDGIQYTEPFVKVYEQTPDYGIDGALQVSAVWSAIELLTDNIASLPIFVYERANDAEGHKQLARDTEIFRLLHDNPNLRHTPMELWQFLTMNFLLRGNAFARLDRNDRGEVIQIWPLSSDQVEVEVLRDNSVIYKYMYDGRLMVYSADSIFHWRDKGNGIIGMSRLDYMRSSLNVAVQAQNHLANVFRKSAKRPGVFMIDKLLTSEQRDSIRQNYKGLTEGNDDDLLVLEAGARFEPLNMTPADVQLLETRKYSVEDIARWFGIPGALINDTNKTTTWGTGIDQLIQGFYKFRLRPMLESLEQAIERRILTPRQREIYTVEFNLDAILRGSLKDRLETGSQAVQNGLMTRNEWRQLENLPPMVGADELTAQVNLMPVRLLGASQQTETATAQVEQRQQEIINSVKNLIEKSEKPIQVNVNPEIKVNTPEVKVDLQFPEEKKSVKKNIKLIRDDKGNVISAESTEQSDDKYAVKKKINLTRDKSGNIISAQSIEV